MGEPCAHSTSQLPVSLQRTVQAPVHFTEHVPTRSHVTVEAGPTVGRHSLTSEHE
jgi:hypothetical protein